FFASTRLALEVVERFLGLKLRMDELEEGTLVQLELGRETSRKRFNPDRRFEDEPLPPVRAPKEAALCLRRLATLVAAASRSSRRALPRLRLRGGAPARGTGRSTTLLAWRRTCGRSATRSRASRRSCAPPTSRRTSAAGRAAWRGEPPARARVRVAPPPPARRS